MTDARQPAKLRVFISYSRVDEAFADELKLGLEDKGYAVAIDRHSIRQGEEWQPRLAKLIADNETVIFVLSPDSARSEICHWEVEEAHRQGKRIIPVLHRGLSEPPKGTQQKGAPWSDGPAQPPQRLSLINYPRFDEGRSFMVGLRGLVQALEDDLDWIEAHSRLAARARDWDDGGRTSNRLMSGADIEAAKRLIETRKSTAPLMLPVQLDFIQASEAHEAAERNAREKDLEERRKLAEDALAQSRRVVQRTRIGLAIASMMAVFAGGASWLALTAKQEANAQRAAALEQAELARLGQVKAVEAAEQAKTQAELARTHQRRSEQALALASSAFPYLLQFAQTNADRDPDDPEAREVGKVLFFLGQYYQLGMPSLGIAADREKGLAFIQHAATFFGDQDAQFELGRMHLEERLEPDKQKLGLHWLSALVQKGDRRAQAVLGSEYLKGEILQRDPIRGLALLLLAKENARPEDGWIREMVANALEQATSEDKTAAERMADVFSRK